MLEWVMEEVEGLMRRCEGVAVVSAWCLLLHLSALAARNCTALNPDFAQATRKLSAQITEDNLSLLAYSDSSPDLIVRYVSLSERALDRTTL
jgi:hypothetical protein